MPRRSSGNMPRFRLAATASCADVATYASMVIGAASFGSKACSAMLKAQMLAVALDVYFHDVTPDLSIARLPQQRAPAHLTRRHPASRVRTAPCETIGFGASPFLKVGNRAKPS